MRHIDGLAVLAPSYRGLIVDLWGVIHDGVALYAGALDCLRQLRERGMPVVLLSNAPRRAHAAAAGLATMGIGPELYDMVMTSGEATWRALATYAGAAIYHLGPPRDLSVIEGHGITLVRDPRDARLFLNTGPDDSRDPTHIGEYLPELAACLDAGLTMLCANPDLEVMRGGQRLICAGALAQRYATDGGTVRWIGKPFPEVYDPVFARLGLPRRDVLAVGDALRTDIAGAAAVGVDALWVLGGIHGHADPQAAVAEAQAAGLAPVATIPGFSW